MQPQLFTYSNSFKVKRFHIPPEESCPYNAACSFDSECSGNCGTELKCLQINASGERRCVTNDYESRAFCFGCQLTGKSMLPGRNKNGKNLGRGRNF